MYVRGQMSNDTHELPYDKYEWAYNLGCFSILARRNRMWCYPIPLFMIIAVEVIHVPLHELVGVFLGLRVDIDVAREREVLMWRDND